MEIQMSFNIKILLMHSIRLLMSKNLLLMVEEI